ncbi:hypothetical protein LSAT2_006535 [Lamellibrachia satsuma]|nr:hypothetical protein LSAT2_006535 [Lamellibrachia satsuma]
MFDPGALGIIRIQLDDDNGDGDVGYRDYHNVSDGSPGSYGDIPPGGSSNAVYNGSSGSTKYHHHHHHHHHTDRRGGSNHVPFGSNSATYTKESSRGDRLDDPSDSVKVVYHRDGNRYDLPLDDGTFVYRNGAREGDAMPPDGRGVTHHRDDSRKYGGPPEGHRHDTAGHHTTGRSGGRDKRRTDKRFLRDVQHELEEQREEWRYEIERLLAKSELKGAPPPNASNLGTNSYVDTSTGVPVFKAFVDVREFSPRHVSVHLDRITNKVIVKAVETTAAGAVTKTFTHKVSLPRFADEQRMTSRMNKKGILKIEVPLLYHFPQVSPTSGAKTPKSFVYQVNTSRDGDERLEILVNTGSEYSARDLLVEVTEDGKLAISVRRRATDSAGRACSKTRRLKEYTLPPFADVDGITSRLSKDGRLQVNVPLKKRRATTRRQ